MQRNILEQLLDSEEKYPNKVVFSDVTKAITYAELLESAKKIASFLLEEKKTGTRKPVVVFIDRDVDSLVAFFGVAFSGNFYVPVDRQMPLKRIELIIETLNPIALVIGDSDEKLVNGLEYNGSILKLDTMLTYDINEELIQEVQDQQIDTDPLYAIFTSGSTGVPKGVLVSHRSVIDLIDNFKEEFYFNDECVFGNQAPFDFDVSVKDIYSTIKNGGTMHIIPKIMFSFPGQLIAYMNEKRINTVIWAASALRIVANFKTLEEEVPKYLKTAMFSGEVMSNKTLNYWRSFLPDVMYVNLYGPTEITCNCTFYKVERPYADDECLPIGKAFKNTDILLLDAERKNVVNENEIGEICVRGTSLALGYYNNPERTAEAFIQNPLNQMYPELIYCTGDLGKYDQDGNLLFVSRKDYQIKHMGHRIELGEIEVCINAIEFIDAACCIYDKEEEKIVLFYQAEKECNRELLMNLRNALPKYMFPNKLHYLEQLPMNKNGKIDRVLLKEKFIDLCLV